MGQRIEAPPYLNTDGDINVRNNIYLQFFKTEHLGNIKGDMPIMGVDFNETEAAYAKRLRAWRMAENEVIFDGWKIKDMKHWQLATSLSGEETIMFEFNAYTVTLGKKEYKFPTHPDTVDDFINDCKRIGLKLFWKQDIIDKFGAKSISSERRVIEFHKILRQPLS